MNDVGERLYRRLLALYRREFRHRYEEDLIAFFRQDRQHPKYGAGWLRPIRFWAVTLKDLMFAAAASRGGWPHPRFNFRNDLRDAWRGLRASPGVTLSILVILTLGIGSSTAMFSVVDAVALRGLPFDEADRLVDVSESYLELGGRPTTVAPQNYFDLIARQHVFASIGASANAGNLTSIDRPGERAHVVRLTASLFDVLRVSPAIGRRFVAADERPGNSPVALLSDAYWRVHFNASLDVIGQVMKFDAGMYEIVGVMPAAFTFPIGSIAVSNVDFWIPFVPGPRDVTRDQGRSYFLSVVGRLKPGITVRQAGAEVQQIHDELAVQYPRWFKDHGVVVRSMQDAIVGASVRSWMLLLLGAVGCVLLIACLNVANLLLARAVSRGREAAVRAAIGASPWDLARALVVESLSLSVVGSACGVLLAFWGVRLLRATLPTDLPRLADVGVDLRVLVVAALASIVTGVFFGTLPALQTARPDVTSTLRPGGRSQTGSIGARRLRMGLVTSEVAMAVVLLAAAGLFLSSFLRVVTTDLGFDPEGVLTITVAPKVRGLPQETRIAIAHPQVMNALERARAVPGVVAAAVVGGSPPLEGGWMTVPVELAGSGQRFTEKDEALVHDVTDGYLNVMRSSLLRGRWVEPTDTASSPAVVVLSEEAVLRYFGGTNPIGRVLIMNKTPRTVVGVVRSSRFHGPERDARPEGYVPFLQGDQTDPDIIVRVGSDLATIAQSLQTAIQGELPGGFVAGPQTLDSFFAAIVAQRKFNMIVLVLFGGLAILIAVAGVYGLMAFLVTQRTREIGVRLALGAAPRGILRMVLGRALGLMTIGLLMGLAIVTALERLVHAFLFQAEFYTREVYGAVALLLVLIGLAAAFGPARRAARVDPLVALRAE